MTFEWANAMALPYADGEFATATVGFGARNFSDLDRGLAEMARVVRPGGTVVVLEITTPTRPPLSGFYRLWFDRVVPLIGKVAGDPQAYEYLPNSVKRFPAPGRARGADGPLRPGRALHPHGGGHHRPARRHEAVGRRDAGLSASATTVQGDRARGGRRRAGLLARVEERLMALATGHGPVLAHHAGAHDRRRRQAAAPAARPARRRPARRGPPPS